MGEIAVSESEIIAECVHLDFLNALTVRAMIHCVVYIGRAGCGALKRAA